MINEIKEETDEYKRFENTPGHFRAVRIVEKQTHNGQGSSKNIERLVEISNETTEPFSGSNTTMLFSVDGLRKIVDWAEKEIEKRQ